MRHRDPAKTATVVWRPETRLHGSGLLTAALLIALAAVLIVVMGCGADRDRGGVAAEPPAAASGEVPSIETAEPPPPEQDRGVAGEPEPPETEPEGAALPADPEERPELSSRGLTPPVVEAPDPVAAERRAAAERERRLREREAEIAAREAAVTRRETEVVELSEPAAETQRPAPAPAPEPDAPAVAEVEPAPVEPPAPPPPPRVETRLAAGTGFDVEFLSTLSSATSRVGDTFRARVIRDVYDERGILVVPAGSEVVGTVNQAEPLRRVGGRASLGLELTDLVLPGGETAPLQASFLREGRSETGRDAATIGGAAAGGAILGRILDRDSKKRASVIGAIIGAAAGTVIAAKTPGEEVEIPAGTAVALELDRELRLEVPERRR